MKILAICQNYPNFKQKDILGFVHTRNLYYRAEGHEVEVLSFAADESYQWDEVSVWTEKDLTGVDDFDVCVFHAPNLRNGMRFMWKNRRQF